MYAILPDVGLTNASAAWGKTSKNFNRDLTLPLTQSDLLG
jgi:hypothetical protein